MKIVTSYNIEIKNVKKIFRQTIKIYQDAISFCIKAFEENWYVLKDLEVKNREQYVFANKLIHSTKSNKAKYEEFDKKFYKMPTFLRIAVINQVLGYLNAFHNENSKMQQLQSNLNKLKHP